MDLGRTVPSHSYFSTHEQKGGQKVLSNVLRAYAVGDPDTGYCQGLSFTGAMLLLHTKSEEAAFKLLSQFMNVYNYKDVYAPDFSELQLRLYQLSRLVHDELPTVHAHLSHHDITPFYYAAPWFLTIFSSQYPISFVARVMDLLFFHGPDIVFKVAVAMLHCFEEHILRCRTMERISEFLKDDLPSLVSRSCTQILTEALALDLGNRLPSYETEYNVMVELTTSFSFSSEVEDLRALSEMFQRHNKVLIDQLALCRGMIRTLSSTVTALQDQVRVQDQKLEKLMAAQTQSPSSSLSS